MFSEGSEKKQFGFWSQENIQSLSLLGIKLFKVL